MNTFLPSVRHVNRPIFREIFLVLNKNKGVALSFRCARLGPVLVWVRSNPTTDQYLKTFQTFGNRSLNTDTVPIRGRDSSVYETHTRTTSPCHSTICTMVLHMEAEHATSARPRTPRLLRGAPPATVPLTSRAASREPPSRGGKKVGGSG